MREMLRRNLGYKILSLILALLFWLWVTKQGSTQILTGDQMLTVPLISKNQPVNSIIMSKLPAVRVRLQGTNPNLNVKDLYAYIDLTGGMPGEQTYTVNMDVPQGIKVLELKPESIAVQIDVVQEKVLPVQVNSSGIPAEGYVAGNPIIKPTAVSVRGPGNLLSTLDKVMVDVSIAEMKDSLQASRPVLFRDKAGKPIFGPDPSVAVLTAYPSSVEVFVPIQPKGLASKLIPLRVISTGTPAAGMAIRSLLPVPAKVQVLGTPEALNGFDWLTLGPIDVSNLAEDKVFNINTENITLPNGISFVPGTNITVAAQIGKGPVQKNITGIPVKIKNIPIDLVLEKQIPPVEVIVKGLPEVLETLTADKIELWVDANGLSAGSYPDTKVNWQLPSNVEMVSVPSVTLNLKAKEPVSE